MRAMTDATAGLLKPLRLDPDDRLELRLDAKAKHFVARVYAADRNGHRNWPSPAAQTAWLERIPEKKEVKGIGGSQWLLAATDYTAEVVNAVWGGRAGHGEDSPPRLDVDKEAATMLAYLLASTARQDTVAERYAVFKTTMEACLREWKEAKAEGRPCDWMDDLREEHKRRQLAVLPREAVELDQHPDLPLEPYQLAATHLSMLSEGYNLFMEQGTGKTPIVVARVMNECMRVWREQGRAHRTIVVAPKAVRLNWQREFQRFCTLPGRVEVVRGGAMDRARTLIEAMVDEEDCYYSVCVLSWEGLKGSWDFLEHIEWDLGVLDEAHYAKRPMTARSQYTRKLRDRCRRRMGLTGTPVSNTPLDLYALFEFLGEGWSGFQAWKAFKNFYGVFEDTGDGYSKLVSIQNLPFMKERLTRTAFVVTKEEAMPWLPEKTFDVIETEMSPAQREAYDRVAKELTMVAEDELSAEGVNKAITVQNILTQLLRLAQIASGFIVWDKVTNPDTGEVIRPAVTEFFDENPKLETLIATLKEKGPREKTIVWSCFVPCIDQISRRLEAEGIRHVKYWGAMDDVARTEAEDAFNSDDSVRVFVGNQAAGGTGLNLLGYPPHHPELSECNADHHIFYVCNWSYVMRAQAGDRNHRRGTRVPVRESDLVVPETLDEDIRVRVMEKKMMAMEVADIKDILATVIKSLAGVGLRGGE